MVDMKGSCGRMCQGAVVDMTGSCGGYDRELWWICNRELWLI